MKKCQLDLRLRKSNHCITTGSGIVLAMWLILVGCTNPENDLTVKSPNASSEADATSTAEARKSASEKCVVIGQEITDRHREYNSAFTSGDVDKLYYDFWTSTYFEFTPNFALNREGMRERMTNFYGSGGKLYSYDLQSLERFVYGNTVYDLGAYDNVGATASGSQFIINGYYFLRWIKGQDGKWHVDMASAGSRGNTIKVTPTTDEGPVVCNDNDHPCSNADEAAINQKIADRFEAYKKALVSADLNAAARLWSTDAHLYGQGLDLNRKGLYEYYRQLFQTGRIVSYDIRMHARFVHDNAAYEFGQSDITMEINGVQSAKKTNYILRWEKGHDGVWHIDRIIDLFRL